MDNMDLVVKENFQFDKKRGGGGDISTMMRDVVSLSQYLYIHGGWVGGWGGSKSL